MIANDKPVTFNEKPQDFETKKRWLALSNPDESELSEGTASVAEEKEASWSVKDLIETPERQMLRQET